LKSIFFKDEKQKEKVYHHYMENIGSLFFYKKKLFAVIAFGQKIMYPINDDEIPIPLKKIISFYTECKTDELYKIYMVESAQYYEDFVRNRIISENF